MLLVNELKYSKKKHQWVPATWWETLKSKEESDLEFTKISKINATNRRSGAIDGNALVTHTLGRKSCYDVFKELGESATPHKLFEKTRKKKKGEWVNPRAAQTHAAFKEEMSRPTSIGEAPDEYRSYYNAVNGFDKKSRLFGTGDKRAEVWYEPPYNKGARRSFSYAPSMVSQIATQMNNE
ncbi:uncharacterized protein LOC141615080 [Silene latifolia]|uniref:uncharacterized protein LOC141615080 n=1 Tax=Silene latifolia TaxID=37657 RepID=UPI003D77AAC7